MDKQEYIKRWAEKLQISVEDINKEFDIMLEKEKITNPQMAPEELDNAALKQLVLQYKRQLRSPAIQFEGILIGASDCVDIIQRQRKEAEELYRTDPQTAISEGITNDEGIPLDTRKEFASGQQNRQYGKPLPDHNYLRNIWGIAKPSKSEDTPQLFNMVLSGHLAENEDIPLFKPVRFMAIKKETKLNSSTFTKFVVDETLELPEFKQLVDTYIKILKIGELESYHTANKDDFNRLCIVEGDVSMVNQEPTQFGSRVMVLEDIDASLEDLDSKSLTCWVPERIELDFMEGSKVLCVGRTGQAKVKDEQGNATEELQDVSMNVFGVYAIPEFKVPIENLEEQK